MNLYTRPGWKGDALKYSDGREDPEWSQCPSCLGYHHERSLTCNGKREPCTHQCVQVLGEIRCHRPANHQGEHEARSSLMEVAWRVLSEGAVTGTFDALASDRLGANDSTPAGAGSGAIAPDQPRPLGASAIANEARQ